MPNIVDTTTEFEKFARKAGLESPLVREQLFKEMYQEPHSDIFDAYFEQTGSAEGVRTLVRQLSKVRKRVKEAAEQMPGLIEKVEPAVREATGLDDELIWHILLVGTFSTNAFVTDYKDHPGVYHCLEWFSAPETTSVLVAHEYTHALHQAKLGSVKDADLAWTAFYEAAAIAASREAVPDRPENDYFWYGVGGFDTWLQSCRDNSAELFTQFKRALKAKDQDEAVEAFFGSGFVAGHWRAGYFLADRLASERALSAREMAQMSVEEGRRTIIEAAAGI